MVRNQDTGVIISTAGLRFEAPGGQKFYVNYRGSSNAQSTSLTAKGRQALGTAFKWGGAPNYGTTNEQGTSLGIMASENNTTVDIFGYDPNCEFRLGNDRDGITSNTIQVVLDAGESFVLEAHIAESTANVEGWLGASVVSDKPVAISNGGLNYAVVNGSGGSRDAGIDQPVPESNLGKDYIFVRGGGRTETEFPIIIATQNNTEIYVNGSATPIATINNGDYFIVPGTNYSNGLPGANMYVRTSKDVYAYQNLAGTTGRQTVGLNFVAPLNCLIPDTVNNIPNITDAAGTTLTGGITIIAATTTPDVNIIVTDGSGVVTKPASQPVAGNTDWKTFYIPNLTGNVDVQSTGPVAVGFFGGNGNRGIAGYFSGFDVAPNVDLQITGTQCLPGSNLVVVGEAFDAYQWFFDGNPIAGATGTTYNPTVAGDYFVRVTKGPCTYDSNNLQAYYCNPDIQIIKTSDTEQVDEGSNVTFTITAQNFGVDPATNLVVTEALPTGLSLVSATPSAGSWSSPNWNIGTLNSGQLETLTVVATADNNSAPVQSTYAVNTVSNSQDQTDNNIKTDRPTAAVVINNDFDGDGIVDVNDVDDDNDGILDCTESDGSINYGTFSWTLNSPSGNQTMDVVSESAISNWFLSATSNYSFSGITGASPFSAISLTNVNSNSFEEALENDDYIQVSFTTAANLVNPVLNNVSWGWYQPSGGDSYTISAALSADGFASSIVTIEDLNITNDGTSYQNFDMLSAPSLPLSSNTTYTLRVYVYGQVDDDSAAFSMFDDLSFTISACRAVDSDSDTIPDSYELDADNDGCSDANEAYGSANADGGDGGHYGTGTPPATNWNGTVTAASYTAPLDNDGNAIADYQELGTGPAISVAPTDQRIFLDNNAAVSLTASDTDTYQWEVSTDGGTTFTAIADGSEYSGTQTDALTILSPDLDKNGHRYRAVLDNDSYVCGQVITNEIILSVGPATVITNRRITIRVNKN
ncbi:DUF11 domain-containing protein [Maribacter sp. 2307ULW6-5]|uniref:DUF11 domain-containing protein n=1 Tax=Maribacter sp. 2307ULW6-5 TaxID=3386275 RepID=UPI0039BD8256